MSRGTRLSEFTFAPSPGAKWVATGLGTGLVAAGKVLADQIISGQSGKMPPRRTKKRVRAEGYVHKNPKRAKFNRAGHAPRIPGLYGPSFMTKIIDNEIEETTLQNAVGAAGSLAISKLGLGTALNGTIQGVKNTDRIGKKMIMNAIFGHLSFRFHYQGVSASKMPTFVRVILFLDMQNNSEDLATAAGLITHAAAEGERTFTYRDMNFTDKFKVLIDKTIFLTGNDDTPTENVAGALEWNGNRVGHCKFVLPKLNIPVQYSVATGLTGASISSNALYCMAICNGTATNGAKDWNGFIRCHFQG